MRASKKMCESVLWVSSNDQFLKLEFHTHHMDIRNCRNRAHIKCISICNEINLWTNFYKQNIQEKLKPLMGHFMKFSPRTMTMQRNTVPRPRGFWLAFWSMTHNLLRRPLPSGNSSLLLPSLQQPSSISLQWLGRCLSIWCGNL